MLISFFETSFKNIFASSTIGNNYAHFIPSTCPCRMPTNKSCSSRSYALLFCACQGKRLDMCGVDAQRSRSSNTVETSSFFSWRILRFESLILFLRLEIRIFTSKTHTNSQQHILSRNSSIHKFQVNSFCFFLFPVSFQISLVTFFRKHKKFIFCRRSSFILFYRILDTQFFLPN